ncbi:FxsB family cyclophane-forming radical SAM/SPASM peptide maturase [Actinoplanes sp. TFC3]|uniref:FxsB family cyclophane-forming radical SAM/SPASM peptide maturase n=1 Tax=Actinoplanes sp. TFC3 TaxID=1710355 RepID=UPI000A69BE04|nr:FxsB family cyclophane-forming radical SAM/SPASM peptide maturase [Actinoplanes sp. TFC3]
MPAFREFVMKVHQRCNLACDYCYVYELADQSWRDRPAAMSPAVWQAAARRIAEHDPQHADVVLHGGEPLLAGRDALVKIIGDLRATLPSVSFRLQTNGALLTPQMLTTLADHDVRIGVSLDGPAAQHDRRRRHRDGRGSHVLVDRALRLLADHPAYGGILCTVDVSADPVDVYEALLEYRPPTIDLLLPHANWEHPPGPGYADWMITVFDRWYSAPTRETGIRLFEEIINLVLGGTSRSDQVGLSPAPVVVIESDGTIEQVDSLKSAYQGAAATGLNVFDNALDEALRHPGIVARQAGLKALAPSCLACPVHDICGAGHYAHRYRAGAGFKNPSAYCADLRRLIDHVATRIAADVK